RPVPVAHTGLEGDLVLAASQHFDEFWVNAPQVVRMYEIKGVLRLDLPRVVTEDRDGGRTGVGDGAVACEQSDRVRAVLDQRPEAALALRQGFLGFPALGDVLHHRLEVRDLPICRPLGASRQAHRYRTAVATLPRRLDGVCLTRLVECDQARAFGGVRVHVAAQVQLE